MINCAIRLEIVASFFSYPFERENCEQNHRPLQVVSLANLEAVKQKPNKTKQSFSSHTLITNQLPMYYQLEIHVVDLLHFESMHRVCLLYLNKIFHIDSKLSNIIYRHHSNLQLVLLHTEIHLHYQPHEHIVLEKYSHF